MNVSFVTAYDCDEHRQRKPVGLDPHHSYELNAAARS